MKLRFRILNKTIFCTLNDNYLRNVIKQVLLKSLFIISRINYFLRPKSIMTRGKLLW